MSYTKYRIPIIDFVIKLDARAVGIAILLSIINIYGHTYFVKPAWYDYLPCQFTIYR